MKHNYKLLFTLVLVLGMTSVMSAQRYLLIEPSGDPANPTDIFPAIMGDTTDMGERVDSNTIYQLRNGEVYVTTDRIVNKPGWKLHIEAEDLEDTENKAILSRLPNTSGTYPDVMRPEGDVELRNLWVIVGEKGPLEQHDWGKIRFMGPHTRIVITDCIMEKDRGGFVQVRADSQKIYINNCVFRNGGNRRILQGNGRGVDARNFAIDTLIVKNTIVHNIQDRFFRSQGGTVPHNYIEFDHNTSFNTVGRHGHIQLGRVNKARITNNIFVNPIMLGTSPFYTDEQTQPDNESHKVITLDTVYEGTELAISNNNIFWTQDVIDYWNSNDTVSAPEVLSQLVQEVLADDAQDAYFEEVLDLNSVPQTVLQYVVDLYANPAAEDMFDFIVEDSVLLGTAFDSGNLFDFETFDPCYDENSDSATGGTSGGAVGATAACEMLVGLFDQPDHNEVPVAVFPNPNNGDFTVQLFSENSDEADIMVYDVSGRVIIQRSGVDLYSGTNTIDLSVQGSVSSGLYFLTVATSEGIGTSRFMID